MDVTALLERAKDGDDLACAQVVQATYEELHRIASARMRRERQDHTWTPTALVHEVSAKFLDQSQLSAGTENEFLALAARAMRNLLVDYARARNRQKRGGRNKPGALEDALVASQEQCSRLLELHEALDALNEVDERKAKVVEFRYFGGLSIEETARALDVSIATVKRDWEVAKAWLMRDLKQGESHDE